MRFVQIRGSAGIAQALGSNEPLASAVSNSWAWQKRPNRQQLTALVTLTTNLASTLVVGVQRTRVATGAALAAAVETALHANLEPQPGTMRGFPGGVLRYGAPAEAGYASLGYSVTDDDDRFLFLFQLVPAP